jgi:hypothetical protein
MSWWSRTPGAVLWLSIGAAACLAGAPAGQDGASVMQGLRLPLEHYPDGKVRVQVIAQKANVPPAGDIQAEKVRVEVLTPAGELEELLLLNDCTCNRESKTLATASPLRMERKGVVVTGTGLTWKSGEQAVRILDNVKVVLDHSIGIKGKK